MSILFLGKKGDQYALDASVITSQLFEDVTLYQSSKAEVFPEEVLNWSGDWIISYLCQRIVPESLLGNARCGAINFHPGPPQYPGIGCTNFALYNEEKEFGVTCHHMAPKVDSGGVIAVSRFPVFPEDTVLTLTKKCYAYLPKLYVEIVSCLVEGKPLPASDERWGRKPYTRKELDALCRLTVDMDEKELSRRIRATTFPDMPGPYIELNGKRFILEGTKPIPK